jgi:hypothetical protein
LVDLGENWFLRTWLAHVDVGIVDEFVHGLQSASEVEVITETLMDGLLGFKVLPVKSDFLGFPPLSSTKRGCSNVSFELQKELVVLNVLVDSLFHSILRIVLDGIVAVENEI